MTKFRLSPLRVAALAAIFLTGAVGMSGPALAQDVDTLVTIKGSCVSVDVPNTNATCAAISGVLFTHLRNGRALITFALGNGHAGSFIGEKDSQPKPELYYLYLSRFRIATGGSDFMTKIGGQCVIHMSRDGGDWSRIDCDARDENDAPFVLHFVSSAATDTASLNGFATSGATTSVSVNIPPVSPSTYTADITAVQVKIQQTIPRLLSGLFLSADPVLTVSSTARLTANGNLCVLALSGQLSTSGSSNLDSSGCAVGSNATGTSVSMKGASQIKAKLITAVGSCSGCTSNGSTPYKTNQPATPDPFAYLQGMKFPTSCPSGAVVPPSSGSVSNPTGTAYWCSNVSFGSSTNLAPGTYILYNSSLSIGSNASVTCSACTVGGAGVTFVFTGSSASTVGTLSTGGGSSIAINAPSSGPFNGLVLYRDVLGSAASMSFGGGSNSAMNGAFYAPTTNLSFGGGSNASVCHILIAAAIDFSGSAGVSTGACGQMNPGLGGTSIARITE